MKNEIRKELKRLRGEVEEENINWGGIVYLQEHQEEIKELGDIVLAQWAGIPEEEWHES